MKQKSCLCVYTCQNIRIIHWPAKRTTVENGVEKNC